MTCTSLHRWEAGSKGGKVIVIRLDCASLLHVQNCDQQRHPRVYQGWTVTLMCMGESAAQVFFSVQQHVCVRTASSRRICPWYVLESKYGSDSINIPTHGWVMPWTGRQPPSAAVTGADDVDTQSHTYCIPGIHP